MDSEINVKQLSLVEAKLHGSRLSPVTTTSTSSPADDDIIYDVCAYVIHCPKHQKIAVAEESQTQYVWLPFVCLPSGRVWNDSARDGVISVLANYDNNLYNDLQNKPVIDRSCCVQMFRLQLPQTQSFQTRLIYYIKLSANADQYYKCCTNNGNRIRWLTVAEASDKKLPNLWGPEVWQFVDTVVVKALTDLQIVEHSLDAAFAYVPRDPPRNHEEDMLKSTNYSEKDVERLFSDYMEHCFPSFYMTIVSFKDYMCKYGFERQDKRLDLLFRAFNYHRNDYLTFHEFLLGLTSMDPMAKNGQTRIKFIFTYYDLDGDGYLSRDEFQAMVADIYPKESAATIDTKVSESMTTIGQKIKGIYFDDFYRAVGAHMFRGTHALCRSNRPIVQQISRSMVSRTLSRQSVKMSLASMLRHCKYKGVCLSCREKTYEYAIHIVLLNKEGQCIGAQKLPEVDSVLTNNFDETMTKSDDKNMLKKSNKVNGQSSSSEKQLPRIPSNSCIIGLTSDKFSIDYVWNPQSVANYFIQQIHVFNGMKGTHKDGKGLLYDPKERKQFIKLLEKLCSQVEKIVANEDRCVQTNSPAFIIGDIHGNLEDLLTMEKVLWKNLPLITANYIFLGDYVDRGQWGVECAIYIMCMKLLAPNKVVMLRGNHEIRRIQKNYTYYKECLNKYGDKLGLKVFEMTNRVFDRLPFCAVVDDAIYCAHGGIPYDTQRIDDINKQPKELPDPDNESSICWQVMWSDPCSHQMYTETADLLDIKPEKAKGFLPNVKRSTGYLFAEEAINQFLQKNGLTHVVRAHEVPEKGFTFHFGNKCTTIFSSSHYCGTDNEAAVVHLTDEKLRIVRLDTVNNAPACGDDDD